METKKVTYEALEGCNIGSVQIENGRLIVVYECETPEAPKFKRGDFVYVENIENGNNGVFIFESKVSTDRLNSICLIYNNILFLSTAIINPSRYILRYATPEEKQLLLDKMREQAKDWNGENVIDWVWKPKMGDDPYWYINTGGYYRDSCWSDGEIDNERLKENRVFATEALAKQAFTDLQTLLKNAKKY